MNKNKRALIVTWQRLVSEGNTCPRCGSTEDELERSVSELRKRLTPSRIKVVLEKSKLTLEEFKKNPIESNRILFNGKTLESLISAKTGQSQCCNVCGDNKCRTLEINGESHEVISVDLIVKAGLKAVSKNA